MPEITDEFILEKILEIRAKVYGGSDGFWRKVYASIEGVKEPEKEIPSFTLEALLGKTVTEYRQIKNPREFNPECEGPNPEYFDALIFSDETFLLTEAWGDGECSHLDSYYFDGRRVLFSKDLFDPIERKYT